MAKVITGIAIRTDGRCEGVIIPETNRLKIMQANVGGMIELVRLGNGSTGHVADMYINEEGKLNRLPVNMLATSIWRNWVSVDDFIVGDALILGPTTKGGGMSSISGGVAYLVGRLSALHDMAARGAISDY